MSYTSIMKQNLCILFPLIKRNQSASLITVMLTNKSDSADTSEKFVTPREKKIGDLALVLERQRQTIKTLLSSKKEESSVKRDHSVYTKMETRPRAEVRQPQKYQQLCDQILDIGSKLLNGRRTSNLQSYRDVNVSVDLKEIRQIKQQPEQKTGSPDKEMEYLKSDEYRLYLQNLTKDEEGNNPDLLKRMKETRNNNVYTKPTPTSKVFKNLDIKTSARDLKSFRQNRQSQFSRKRENNHNLSPLGYGMPGRQKDYERSLNVFEQISILSNDVSHQRQMRHSPTMKDIIKPIPFQNVAKKQQKESRSVSKNNKIQSRTVDCLVFTGLSIPKSYKKQLSVELTKKQLCQESPKHGRKFKQWNLEVYRIDSPSFKSKSKQQNKRLQCESNSIQRNYEKNNILRESYSHTNIKKQSYKAEFNYTESKHTKHAELTYERSNKKHRIVTLEQSSHQFSDFSNVSRVNIQNVNLYQLNFKLADPKIKPEVSQSKTPVKIYKEKTPSKINEKQNIYFPGKYSHGYKQPNAKLPKNYQQHIIPYVIDIPQNKKWKMQESQATSTVTKSAYDHQSQPRGHSRSKSKLSVVTASKKQRR